MKKKAILFFLTLGSMLALSACGNSSGGKNCNGETCKIGYRINLEKKNSDIVIR